MLEETALLSTWPVRVSTKLWVTGEVPASCTPLLLVSVRVVKIVTTLLMVPVVAEVALAAKLSSTTSVPKAPANTPVLLEPVKAWMLLPDTVEGTGLGENEVVKLKNCACAAPVASRETPV